MGPAEAEPWRPCRSTRVEEMGEALPVLCGRDARAPGGAFSHDAATPTSQFCRSTRTPLVIEGASSLFVSIRGSSSFPKRKRLAVYPVHPVHPCSIYSPSRLIFPVAGLGCAQRPDSQSASRAAASGPISPVPWVIAPFPMARSRAVAWLVPGLTPTSKCCGSVRGQLEPRARAPS